MDAISGLAGVVLSLVFSYIPGARDWFSRLTGDQKRLVMLGACLVVPVAMALLACTGFAADFGLSVTCDRAGIVGLIKAFVVAAITNQTAYQLTPKQDGLEKTQGGND